MIEGTHIQWNRAEYDKKYNGYTYIMNQRGNGAGGIAFGGLDGNNNQHYTKWAFLNGTGLNVGTDDTTGMITTHTFNATSDMRLKENIHDLSNSLEKICAIRGVEYNWKADEEKKLHSGVIAQEVKESIPEAVNTDNEEQYSVNYNAIIGHLIEAVKTLKQEVDDLKGQLKK